MGGGQVPYEHLQLADRLGAQHPVDTLGVLVRGDPAFGEGVVQDVGDAVTLGVGGAELGAAWARSASEGPRQQRTQTR